MVFGNIKAERKAIEMTYEDTCDIVRAVEKENKNITQTEEQTVYTAVPCALSTGNNPTSQTETVNNIQYDAKIFTAPEIEVKAGDKIFLNRLGVKKLLFESVGEPAIYKTHQEIMAKRSDWA